MSIAGLYGRQANRIIAEAAAAGKGLTYVGTGTTVTFPLNGASAIVVHGTYNSVVYSTIIPVNWIGSTSNKWGIACSQTYLGLTVTKDGDTVTVSHGSYTLTCYTLGAVGAGGGGGGESHTHPNLSVLNGITAEQVAAWDAAVTELAGLNAAIGGGTV